MGEVIIKLHPEARRMLSHNRRWIYVYRIEEEFVIVDRIWAAIRVQEVSVIYHTFVKTCKFAGVSVLGYFKNFFNEVRIGRVDSKILLSGTIRINV